MKLQEVIDKFGLEVVCGENALDREVTGAYASDLLSDVMGSAVKGAIWLTVQVHLNIVAVASLNELAAILCVKGRYPDKETIEKAVAQNVVILATTKSTYEMAGQLWELGVRP